MDPEYFHKNFSPHLVLCRFSKEEILWCTENYVFFFQFLAAATMFSLEQI